MIMKNYFIAFSVSLVSLIILFFTYIGLLNLSQYLIAIPWINILIVLGILVIFSFIVDFVFIFLTMKVKSGFCRYLISRWGLFFQIIYRWFIKVENFILILIIIGGLLFASMFVIGVVKAYDVVYTGINKAMKYDTVINDLRGKYQKEIVQLTDENNKYNIRLDQIQKEKQDLEDKLFLVEQQNQKMQVEIKRLLPKGAKKNF